MLILQSARSDVKSAPILYSSIIVLATKVKIINNTYVIKTYNCSVATEWLRRDREGLPSQATTIMCT